MELTGLNEEQKEAVEYLNGPLLVLAGAGSGKTKVLTSRIAYLIDKGIDPYNILAITFTNKAAAEMKQRVVKLIGGEALSMQISTFHSFGLKIIRSNSGYLGLDSNFAIFDTEDSITAVKRVLKRLDIDPNKYNPKSFYNRISSLKNDLISPIDFTRRVKDDFDKYKEEILNALLCNPLIIYQFRIFQNIAFQIVTNNIKHKSAINYQLPFLILTS